MELLTKRILNTGKKLKTRPRLFSGEKRFSGKLVTHKETTDNNKSTYFEFTRENYKEIDLILSKYPSNYKRSGVIPLLMLAQKQNQNFLSLSAMDKVAKILEMPPINVYEVASFYSMFNRTNVLFLFFLILWGIIIGRLANIICRFVELLLVCLEA